MDQRNLTTGQNSAAEPQASVERVRYREGQLLRAGDLNADQAYHIAMRRRHHLGGHGWGTIRGLALDVGRDQVVLQPGMAVDGYGRELTVPDAVRLPLEGFLQAPAAHAVDVWLLYSRTAETLPSGGRWDCGPGQNNRWREEAKLRLTAIDDTPQAGDPRRPVEVSDDDVDFSPHELPPDSPDREWPVYLGRVLLNIPGHKFAIQLDKRPYAALRGDRIDAPSETGQILVGGETDEDIRRFAVRVPGVDGSLTDKIVIDREGGILLQGDTAVLGLGKRFWARNRLKFDPSIDAPKGPAAWQAYRTSIKRDETDTRPDAERIHQLRVEIAHPGKKDDPTLYQLAVGVRGKDGFSPCLIVQADCTIRIAEDANLVVKGRVIEGPIELDPDDPRFLDAVRDQWSQTLLDSAANLPGQLDEAVLGTLKVANFNATDNPLSEASFEFTFKVSNLSGVAIAGVIPSVTLTFIPKSGSHASVGVDTITPVGFDLPAQGSGVVSVKSKALPIAVVGDSLLIEAVVMGTGPIQNTVFDRFEMQLPVTPSLGAIS